MHMQDGLITPQVGAVFFAGSAALLHWSSRKTGEYSCERAPLMGLLGAFVFAAQMVNFAIPGTGASGHLGGGLLLALMLGPWAGFLVLSSVVFVQCLLFADGGVLALGCNIINLGFFPCFVGYPLFQLLANQKAQVPRAAYVLAAVVSVECGAAAVVGETLVSGHSSLPLRAFLGLMLALHLPIGVAEGLLTARLVQSLGRSRCKIPSPAPSGRSSRRLTVMIAGALMLALTASTKPDALSRAVSGLQSAAGVAAGSTAAPESRALRSPFPDYDSGIRTDLLPEEASKVVAGAIGAAVTAVILSLAGLLLSSFSRAHRCGR